MGSKELLNALAAGYDLHWYRIERVLGQGAFGITYLAHDINLDRPVAVKEYMPSALCARSADLSIQPLSEDHNEDFKWGLTRFITEARTLTKFEHPNLVRVFNVFELNNTAYMIMNYEVGESLQQILKRKKNLSQKELIKIMMPLMKGLELIHEKGFIHRDIKPGNVFIRTDGSPVLLDFGSARQTRGRGEAQTLTNFVSPGYAPIEQYTSKSDRQGPWTDIYGMGATLYKAITGISPTTAIDRSEMIMNGIDDDYKSLSTLMKGRYSETFLAAIDHALAFNAENRPKTIAEWREEFGIDEEDIETMRAVVVDEGVKILGKSDTSIHSLEKATTKTVAKTQSDATTINVFGAAEELTTLALSTRASLLRWFRRHKYSAAGIAAAILVAAILLIPGSGEEEARQGATVAAAAPPGTARADSRETPAAKDAAIGSAHSMENRPKESAKPAPKAATRSAPTSVTEVVAAGQANTAPEATPAPETKAASETKSSPKTKTASVAKSASETKASPKTKAAPETKAASEPKLPPVTTVASETKDATETKLPPVTTVAPEPATVPETKTAQKASVERVAAAGSDGENDSNAKRINRLLWRAKTDTRALRLTTPKGNNAYERYQEILSLDGDNEAARKGIQTLSDKYVELAYGAMDSGRRRLAWIYLSRARKLTPASPAIAKARVTLRKQVEQVEQTKQSKQIKPAKHIREAKQAEPQKEKGENSGYLINNVVNWFKNATKDKKDAKDAKSTK
jgi:serine/threonine protein kinase